MYNHSIHFVWGTSLESSVNQARYAILNSSSFTDSIYDEDYLSAIATANDENTLVSLSLKAPNRIDPTSETKRF